MTAKKRGAVKSAPKPKKPADDAAVLARYQHHRDKAEHHRAQADLIEARLRTQGKEIHHQHPGEVAPHAPKPAKPVIVKRRH